MTDESLSSSEKLFGLGADIVEIQRYRDLDPEASFFSKVFTPHELAYCRQYREPALHFAATFAGKEAVIKSMNSRKQLSVSEIEILRNPDGAPYVRIDENIDVEVLVSLAHSEQYAIAVALVVPASQTSNVELFRKLLNETIHEILPGQ